MAVHALNRGHLLILKSHNFNCRLHGTFAASTLIILFSEMLRFSEIIFERTKNCEGKYGIFRNFLFFEMKISNFN
jgi:hypothetical protein